MRFNATGIQAQSKKQFETFSSLRPVGAVSLVPRPDNEYDPFCIDVMLGDVCLGHVPARKVGGKYVGSELQLHIIDGGIKTALIEDYAYIDGERWNREHVGMLGAVTLSIPDADEDFGRCIGGDYMRVTEFIGYLNPYGKSDGLIKWAYSQGATYEDYEKALNSASEAGTAMHAAIEAYFTDGTSSDALPSGWARFCEKYELETIRMEERFYDSTLMVTGQPDWLGMCNGVLTVLDWKSGKKPSLKHKMQLAIYAKNCIFDGALPEAMVVCFGSDNKQGFATSTMKHEAIETYYEAMKHLRKVVDVIGCTWNK